MTASVSRATLLLALAAALLASPSTSGPQTTLGTDRSGNHSATLLPDGRWLVLGTQGPSGLASGAAIWDPAAQSSTLLSSSLRHPRIGYSATLLPDGSVLIAGGLGAGGGIVQEAEVFNPRTQVFEALAGGPTPHAYHTATLLTDGRVAIVGGMAGDGSLSTAVELWDPRYLSRESGLASLGTPRLGHAATMLPDGSVLITGGVDPTGVRVATSEVYDPIGRRFTLVPAPPQPAPAADPPEVRTSSPADGSTEVSTSPLIALRFSTPVRVETVNSQTLTLSGPHGRESVLVIPAEAGMLAFVTPQAPLLPGSTYALSLNGASDASGLSLPFTMIRFTTEGTTPTRAPAPADGRSTQSSRLDRSGPSADRASTDDEWEWKGKRQDGRPYSRWQSLPPLEAPAGVTALAGQVLRLNGEPLPNVTLRMERGTGVAEARTDDTGRFLLEGLGTGHQELLIDGRSASAPGQTYGVFEVGVKIMAGRTTALGYTVWMPRIDTAHAIAIPAYTTSELIVTTPKIPGLELHLPAHAAVRDHEGRPATQVSITPIPPDRPPFPLPRDVDTPAYFTIQPGAGYVYGKDGRGARLIYPNHSGSKRAVPGSRFNFWHYDPGQKGWHIYGLGTVTPDGNQVVPDPKVEIYEFTGAMVSPPRLGAPGLGLGQGLPAVQTMDGEPVNLAAGVFVMQKTDLVLPDIVPIVLTRTYLSSDTQMRAFGMGMTHPYDIFLVGDTNPYSYIDLFLPDGTRIHYDRLGGPGGFANATYAHTATPTRFFGSQITWNAVRGGGWDLRLKDGTVYEFPDGNGVTRSMQAAMTGYRDRFGNALTLTRNSDRDLTRITTPSGRWVAFIVDSGTHRITQASDNTGRTVVYTYDAAGRLFQVRDPETGVTEYTYNASNWMETIKDARGIVYLTNQYDLTGKVIRQTQPLGIEYRIDYTLGTGGVVDRALVTDPRLTQREVAFNTAGYPTRDTRGVGTPEVQTTLYEWEAATNLLRAGVDPLSRRTEYTYDTLGNLRTVTRMAGTAEAVTTVVTYEATFNQVATVTDPLTHLTRFAYDTVGNLTTITDPLNHQTTLSSHTPQGLPQTITTPAGTIQLRYDVGDLVSITDGEGRTTTRFTDAAGRLVSVTDARGNQTRYVWDGLNRLRQVVDPLGGVTEFGYDPNGNLLSVKDALARTTAYEYDAMDRVTIRRDPLLRPDVYQYDVNGNLTQATDRRGKVTTFSYDALNRRTAATFGVVPPSTSESRIDYGYDRGNRLLTVTDSLNGTLLLAYDTLDRLTQEVSPQGTIGYGYDASGRRTSMTVLGQPALTYAWDDADRLTGITRGSATVGFLYDDADRRTKLTLPNGVTVDYAWDAASQLTGLTYKKGGNTLGALTYGYDLAGNRARAGGSWARTGLPDAVTSASYNAANHQLALGGRTMTYDLAGNLQTLAEPTGTTALTWDARGQLTSLSTPDGPATFQYDGLGRRRSKTIHGVQTSFLYDGLTPVQELSGGTATANLLTGLAIDEYFTRTTTAGTRTLLPDALGSTVALTDDAGTVQTEYTYEPFGPTTETGADSSPFQYTGRENDNTGLYYYRARYYHPGLQRFITEDPIEFDAGDVNLYTYVSNAPTVFNDPSGLIIDIIADVGFIGYDIYTLVTGGRKDLGVNLLALGGDIVGAIVPGVTGVGVGIRSAKAVAGNRARALIRNATANPGRWRTVAVHTEEATGRAVKGGTSIQEVLENVETGERLVRHTLVKKSGRVVDSHLRPTYKPRPGDLFE